MTNETQYINETPAEREAYDALEILARKWQARAAADMVFRAPVHPRAKTRSTARKVTPPSLWNRMTAVVSSLFTAPQYA